ncbi:unnamed protein product, partial [Durusdinium trenchii]
VRFATGNDGKLATPASASQPSNQATALAKYLKEILEGRDEASALKACTQSGYGPRETWEELKEQATLYVARLCKDYPPKARKAIV